MRIRLFQLEHEHWTRPAALIYYVRNLGKILENRNSPEEKEEPGRLDYNIQEF